VYFICSIHVPPLQYEKALSYLIRSTYQL